MALTRGEISIGRRRIMALLGLLLAGCAAYQAQPLNLADNAQRFAARRLDAPQLRDAIAPLLPAPPASWPPSRWDRGMLLAVALVDNPQLAVARAEVGAAAAREVAAAERPNPVTSLQSEYALRDTRPWLYGISFELPLRTPGRRRLAIDAARLDRLQARWALVDRTWDVRRSLIRALSDWRAARERERTLEQLSAAQARLLDVERRRVAAGEDAPATLLALEADAQHSAQERARSFAEASSAQAAAAAALGLPPPALDGLALDWPDWGAPPALDEARLDAAREQALLTRADLAAAIADYDAAEKRLQLAVARQYPELVLSPGYYWDHGISKFPLDVAFELPLFNRHQGEIAQARAARELAGENLLALQARIYGEIAAARAQEDLARQAAAAADQRLQQAQRQAQDAALALKLGAADAQVPLTADVARYRAQLEALEARAALQGARNALEDALHTPLSGPELDLRRPPPPSATNGEAS
ncbi:MAG: TolC family protein [Nevskia sp.]|nr:TolC family protein [Nevskia sp.]